MTVGVNKNSVHTAASDETVETAQRQTAKDIWLLHAVYTAHIVHLNERWCLQVAVYDIAAKIFH